MKRHPALAPLSRDHQHALAIAHRLRQADATSAAEAREAFASLWEQEEREHFRAEEEILLPAYASHGGDPEHPLVTRVLREHLEIRRDALALTDASASLSLLHDLGTRLSAHVRMEERQLFPLIEAALPEPELEALAAPLSHHAD